MNSVSGRGTDAIKMGNELGVNSSISEVPFHHAELRLSVVLPLIELNPLALYRLEFALMRPIPIDISDDTRVLEIDDGVVDEESGSRGGVENVEVVILDPRMVEIGGGMCMCMKGDGEFRVAMLASSYKMSVDPNLSEGDVACHFILAILIEEDKQVLPRITTVVLAPSGPWMVWIIKLLSKLRDVGNGTRCGGEGDGRVVLSEPNWFVVLHVVI